MASDAQMIASASSGGRPGSKRQKSAADVAVERWSRDLEHSVLGETSSRLDFPTDSAGPPPAVPAFGLPTLSPIPSPPTVPVSQVFSPVFSISSRIQPIEPAPSNPSGTPPNRALQSLPLLSFLNHYPHPVFVLPAEPLHTALCLRVDVGLSEDPESGGPLVRNLLSDGLAYPGVVGKQADAGRSLRLEHLLRPVWVNSACDAAGGMEGPSVWLNQKQLSRWLNWLREGLENLVKARDQNSAGGNFGFPSSFETGPLRKGSTEEMFFVATLVDTEPATPPLSGSGEIKPSQFIVFSTIVRQATGRSARPGPSPLTWGSRLYSSESSASSASSTGTVRGGVQPLASQPPKLPPTQKRASDKEATTALARHSSMRQPAGFLTEREAKREFRRSSSFTGVLPGRGGRQPAIKPERRKGTRGARSGGVDGVKGDDSMEVDEGSSSRRPSETSSSGGDGFRISLGGRTKSQMDVDPFDVDKMPSPHATGNAFEAALAATPMGRTILEKNWSETPLGPMDSWTPTLKTLLQLAIGSPYRMSLLWGPDCVMLYNDEYVKSAGTKHPKLLGQSGSEGWAELWADLGPVADRVLLGEPYTVYDSLLFFDRHPNDPHGLRMEESYHSFSWLPVRAPDGTIEGIWNIAWEVTARVVAERRLATLRNLVQATLVSRTRKDYCNGCLQGVSQNPYDIPFAIMYTCETLSKQSSTKRMASVTAEDDISETSSGTTSSGAKVTLQLNLVGSVAVPDGHPCAPSTVELTVQTMSDVWSGSEGGAAASMASFSGSSGNGDRGDSASSSQHTLTMDFKADDNQPWPFHEACALGKPIYVSNLGSRIEGVELRGWRDKPKAAVVMPIVSGDSGSPLAVIVFGLSPRLYWNETYAVFLNMLSRQFANGFSSVIRLEEEVNRMEELAALDRAKTTFFSNVSHELRTPLTLVIGPITDILDSNEDNLPAGTKERLRVVKRNAQRLINLVNQLLDLSRFEAGRMVARFRPTLIVQMVTDIASLFRSAMTKNDLRLVLDCPMHDQTQVYVDRDMLEKVLFNLLSNALKFTHPGGSVTVRIFFDSTRCYIMCADTGVGIAKSELPRIFERFHRVEESVRQAEGTGIGLALARDIMGIHGGQLDVESEVGRGTTFRCVLYLGTKHLPPENVDTSSDSAIDRAHDMIVASDARRWMLGDIEALPAITPLESPASSDGTAKGAWDFAAPQGTAASEAEILSTRGSLVCLADDNQDMRHYVASILGRYYRVHQVSNGEAALEWCTEHQPDLVLSDVMMPKLDGFQLLRRLKSSPVTAHASVILLSARAGSEARVDGLAAGADDYLVKPFEAKELLARVNTHLQLAKVRQKLEHSVRERTRQLVESEIKFRELAQSFQVITMLSPVGIFKCNALGELVFANKAWHQQSGHSETEPLSGWWDQVDEMDRGPLQARWAEMTSQQTGGRGELRWRNGRESSWDFMSIFNDDGILIGFLGSAADITDRKAAERLAIEEAEQRARDALEAKRQHEEFVDMASHELRNPLSGIVQAAELLNSSLRLMLSIAQQDSVPSPDQLQRLENEIEEDLDAVEGIQLCSTQQLRIANDIIEVSKLSMGLLSVSRVDFDLLARMKEIVAMFRISARREGVDLGIEAGEGMQQPQLINADPNRLAQVVINFLGNGLRYTARSKGVKRVTITANILQSIPAVKPHGRRIGEIRPAAAEAGDDLVFVRVGVQDTAHGLAQDDLSRLFERFAQANPTVDQYGGQGLGLYVSRHLVDLHGGFIEVESILGGGSTFSFTIPARRTFPMVTSVVEAPTSPLAEPLKDLTVNEIASTESMEALAKVQASSLKVPKLDNPPASRGSARHILVVEDNMINIKVLKRQLNIKGYEVSVAMDGRQALDFLYADDAGTSGRPRIDAVLMDIQMPVMDGVQAIKELRAAEKAKTVRRRYPVIAVTGNARKEQVEHFLASGFDEICVKPYRIDEVQSNIEKLFLAPSGLGPAYGTSSSASTSPTTA